MRLVHLHGVGALVEQHHHHHSLVVQRRAVRGAEEAHEVPRGFVQRGLGAVADEAAAAAASAFFEARERGEDAVLELLHRRGLGDPAGRPKDVVAEAVRRSEAIGRRPRRGR